MRTKIGVLGCGNMGGAIVSGASRKTKDFEFHLYDPLAEKSKKLAKEAKANARVKMAELKICEYFLLAVKPQSFAELAGQLKLYFPADGKIISIMAGIASSKIREGLGCKKLARVMPNTPCLIGEGAAAVYFVGMSDAEQKMVQSLFAPIAQVHFVDSDDAVDIVTIGIASGSGYLFEIARILIKKLTAMGLKRETADAMVKEMLKGSAALMQKSTRSPEALRNQVTSKGGTTEAALKVFQQKGLQKILEEALDAAYQRAKKLG
ncbi:MAG: pyrroline-5-carboxylate reductase [Deltaproteobacteria bacterium]|nr:pyrroline-5-carboxylate reductase [Deltaproteobacteria bacterium]